MEEQYNNMDKKIIEKNGNICILYEYNITKFEKVMKNKAGTINTNYSTVFPKQIIELFDVKDRTIFFYEQEGTVYITSRTPLVEHQRIKIQSTKQISIPRGYFKDVANYTKTRFVLNMNVRDQYRHKNGLLSMELM